MQRFQPRAPLEVVPYTPPEAADRRGPPLSQGLLFSMLAMVASDHLSPEALDALARIDPDAWYHGQLLETLLNDLEAKDPELPYTVGRGLSFMLHDDLRKSGISTAAEVVQAIQAIWMRGTRGDYGEWRITMLGPSRARIEVEQPQNCVFEAGGVHGFIECFEPEDVRVDHVECMRKGAPFCVLLASWKG